MTDHIRADSPADPEPGRMLTCFCCGLCAPEGVVTIQQEDPDYPHCWICCCVDAVACAARFRAQVDEWRVANPGPPSLTAEEMSSLPF